MSDLRHREREEQERSLNACNEPGCANVALGYNVYGDAIPEGWTPTVVSSPPAPPVVRLRCPTHPLPPGGIITMGGKQVFPSVRDPDRPPEKEHPELIKLCAGLRERKVPCDGFTPAADALGEIDRLLSLFDIAKAAADAMVQVGEQEREIQRKTRDELRAERDAAVAEVGRLKAALAWIGSASVSWANPSDQWHGAAIVALALKKGSE